MGVYVQWEELEGKDKAAKRYIRRSMCKHGMTKGGAVLLQSELVTRVPLPSGLLTCDE